MKNNMEENFYIGQTVRMFDDVNNTQWMSVKEVNEDTVVCSFDANGMHFEESFPKNAVIPIGPLRVLVLIDCQRDFIDGSLSNKDAQACIPAIVEKINNFKGDVILLTMDTHGEDYLDTPEGKKLPVKHCIYNTWGWKIDDKISNALTQKVIDGVRVLYIPKNTFGSLRADEQIPIEDVPNCFIRYNSLVGFINRIHTKENANLDIEMCGFCTDICVISNALALKAAAYDYAEITIDSKCCAGVTPEKHEAALEVMRSCQINVINED